MRKILWMLLGGGLAISLTYYLFFKPFEYEIKFKAATVSGDLIETIRIWNRSLDSAKIIEVDSFYRLTQSIVRKKREYVYDWHFSSVNDSVTVVNIQISEPNRSLINKILIPFTKQPIEIDAREISTVFYEILKEHLKITSVKILGKTELDSSFCVCRSLATYQVDKANGMMRDYPILTTFIDVHKLSIAGPPSVRIREWDHNKGSLAFDFCFPIKPSSSLPIVDSLFYKNFKKEKVIRAEYHGNYITSDRAWYELMSYANKNGYKVTGLPIEYFYNNPNLGLSQDMWKAEVYLPVGDK